MPRLRYRDEGRGPAVLLVHGWLLDSTMFDSLAQALARRRRVVRWDRRGFGESGGTPSLAADGADGLRLLRELGIARCAVLGSSQGCRVALDIVALEHGYRRPAGPGTRQMHRPGPPSPRCTTWSGAGGSASSEAPSWRHWPAWTGPW